MPPQNASEIEEYYRILLEAAQRQTQELALLDRVRTALSRELDLSSLFRTVVEAIAQTYGYALVSLYLYHDGKLLLQHQVGYKTVIAEIPVDQGVAGRVARLGQPVFISDVHSDPDFLAAIDGIISEICVPLFDQGQVVGILNIESKDGIVLSEADLRFMLSLSEHISVAIGRARLYTAVAEGEARNRALLNALPDMMLRFDRTGRYIEVKAAPNFPPIVPVDQFPGKYPSEILPTEVGDRVSHHVEQTFNTSEMQVFEYQLVKQGSLYDLEARMVLCGSEEVLCIVRDITDRKQSEQQTIQLALERERMALLSQFISHISHDFRTPLATINTHLYLLGKSNDPEKLQHRTAVIAEQVEHMTRLVDSMLTMLRLEREIVFDFKSLDLNQLVMNVVAMIDFEAEKKKLSLSIDLFDNGLMVEGDKAELQQAITEILINAIRYTSEGGAIRLLTYRQEIGAIFEARDTGIGIDPEEWGRLFEPFYRTDKARRVATGGVGLGLAIAKRIIEAHHGRIEVESQVGQGSVFRVWLPLH